MGLDVNDASLLELRLLRAEVAELRADLGTLLRRQFARDDRRLLLALLPLVSELLGDANFTANQLAEVALNERSPLGQALRELIADACADGDSLRPLGELLARAEGVPFAGCRLVSAGMSHGARRWRVGQARV